MKNRPIIGQALTNNKNVVTEWDDNVLFDADDPDFFHHEPTVESIFNNTTAINTAADGHMKMPVVTQATTLTTTSNKMSLASVQHGPPQIADIYCPLGFDCNRSNLSMSSSLSDLVGSPLEISVENVLTIEELRQQMGSCFTCGVSWTDDHVSLDCTECGGYSLERPCPLCDGKCGVQWKRDFTMSHACSKARWHGVCPSYPESISHLNPANAAVANSTSMCGTAAVANQLRLAQELCARLEQLSTGAQT